MEKLIKHKGTHLTISDEPIKVGDWVYWDEFEGEILQVQSMDADYIWFAEDKGCLRAENAYPPYKVLHKLADPVSCVDLNGDIMKECYKVEDAIPATVSATHKLTLTQYEFLKNEVAKTQMEHPGAGYEDWRLGQAWFNKLVSHLPQFGWIRTTKLDPFFRDEVLLDLFFHILDEEAYASWTHSDNYKRLHKEWTDNHPPTPVDTSGSELSDFVDAPLALEFPVETVSYTIPDDWQKALEDSVKGDAETDLTLNDLIKSKLMENETYMGPEGPTSNNEMLKGTPLPEESYSPVLGQVNILHENEHTPMITNNSTSNATVILKPGASIGYAASYIGDSPVTHSNINCGSSYAYKTEPVEEKTVNVAIRFSSKKDLDKTFLLIRDLLSTNPAAELSLQGLEISQW